jgi:exodeoxyribonuclease VII large subunit
MELSNRLISPRKTIEDFRLKIDDRCNQMTRAVLNHQKYMAERLAFHLKRLDSTHFYDRIKLNNVLLNKNRYKVLKSIEFILKKKRFDLLERNGKLKALDASSILKRGYSITRKIRDKKIIKDSETVSIGEHLEIILAKGILTCNVEGKSSHVKEDI